MRAYRLLLLLLCLVNVSVISQNKYFTHIIDSHTKTLQVKVAGEWISNPYIEMNGQQQIEINFDAFSHGYNQYSYSIIHCNGDWSKSILQPIEYIKGFQGLTIDDFATSVNTTTQYTNYKLLLPNDDIQFKVSGNYAVCIYNEDNPADTVLIACFSVVEPMVRISATVSGNTDIDTNQTHQQVSFEIAHKDFPITYPQSDLKLFIYQDNRKDNAVSEILPSNIANDRITYANNRKLIFDAGNEYRRIEFLSNKYNGMGVKGISFFNPYYHVDLITDIKRSRLTYLYDQDQNGRYFIRCSNCDDPNTEADYYLVHFSLSSEEIKGGAVYLNGDLTNDMLADKFRMDYNQAEQRYEKVIMLKQGSYNYQYLFVPNNTTVGTSAVIEGSYFQTENEYTIYVYYSPAGSRYDRLIGIGKAQNKISVF